MESLLNRSKLHHYQTYCIDFIKNKPVSAVFLDCGLGKTIISLTAIYDLALDKFEVGRILVVAPLRVTMVWPSEIKKWEHLKGLSYSVAVGTERERNRAAPKQESV